MPIYIGICAVLVFLRDKKEEPHLYLLHHFNLHLMLESAYNSFDAIYGSDPFWGWSQRWCMGCCWDLMALSRRCKYPVIYTNHPHGARSVLWIWKMSLRTIMFAWTCPKLVGKVAFQNLWLNARIIVPRKCVSGSVP